jgi:uncharacterized protein with gpF-like domain
MDTTARKWEPKYRRAAANQFGIERREILAAVNSEKSAALHLKKTIDYDELSRKISAQLKASGPQWRKRFIPLVEATIAEQGKRQAAQLGFTFDVANVRAAEWFDDYLNSFTDAIVNNTDEKMFAMMQQAKLEGWSIDQVANWIDDMYDLAENQRAETIARTETMRASNVGTYNLYNDWGVEKKEWISTRDDRTRWPGSEKSPSGFNHFQPFPQGADGEITDIDKPFKGTGEDMMFPGDPMGDPGNFINCRCTIAAVIE